MRVFLIGDCPRDAFPLLSEAADVGGIRYELAEGCGQEMKAPDGGEKMFFC